MQKNHTTYLPTKGIRVLLLTLLFAFISNSGIYSLYKFSEKNSSKVFALEEEEEDAETDEDFVLFQNEIKTTVITFLSKTEIEANSNVPLFSTVRKLYSPQGLFILFSQLRFYH